MRVGVEMKDVFELVQLGEDVAVVNTILLTGFNSEKYAEIS